MIDDADYLDRPEQWAELAVRLRASGTMGLDTEYHGWTDGVPTELDDDRSPVGRTRIHVWSVAVWSGKRSPLGHRIARGWCLPSAALDYQPLRDVLEDPSITKAVHNQSVDHHALANHGIKLRGGVNTLGLLRWVRPGFINEPGRFKLKAVMWALLRRTPTFESFKKAMYFEREETVTSWKTVEVRTCSCGELKCRKRAGHLKMLDFESVEVVKTRTVKGHYDLWTVVAGHERWLLFVKYSVDDAVAALELWDVCQEDEPPAPFPFGDTRPSFNQGVEEAIIAMESEGFRIDLEWCRTTLARARMEEALQLGRLEKWYVMNAPRHGPHRTEDIESIWTSGAKKIALFDELGFPRSPIWKKGRVKRGKWCLDGVAMKWIGDNHPPAKQVAGLLLHLQRIRSGKKYLDKLCATDGYVHIICGPAGDEDDRAGAVTGRLGIKGPLEAQQLPTREDLDLFLIRKAIIA